MKNTNEEIIRITRQNSHLDKDGQEGPLSHGDILVQNT